MHIVFGYSFNCNAHYSHQDYPNGISGWNLVNIVMPLLLKKLSQTDQEFHVIRYNFLGKKEDECKYCLAIKLYPVGCGVLGGGDEVEIPVEKIYYDKHHQNENLLSTYYQFLRDCGLKNVDNYIPKFMVI